jgi:type II secretory ATPase GspE/PulE/Tfp pilus assembly ATPase PilB-like protein
MPDALADVDTTLLEPFATEYLRQYQFLPLRRADGILTVAHVPPGNATALEHLRRFFQCDLELCPVSAPELDGAIRRAVAARESVVELVKDLGAGDGAFADESGQVLADARDLALQPPVIRFVNLVIREAADAGASDVHLEATRDGLRARLRIDGVLSELPSPPANLHAAIVSRVKLLAELDVAERRVPQDGRIRIRLEHREMDLRVSTVPTLFGESVVLRLLARGEGAVTLDQLGMRPEVLARFGAIVAQPHGIVLATGPTGSGKTTTLYAAMGMRNAGSEKLITVEDPVEYHLNAVTQVPVHARAGVSFASALRSILRQDPDVLMIGEMRDPETARIAVQAAMTGHLVLSTLHTNDAVSSLARLVDLGIEPYMVAATLDAVLAQRLVRCVCRECAHQGAADPALVALLAEQPIERFTANRGLGCSACRHTGYKGRTGIFELLVVDEEIKRAMLDRRPTAELRRLCAEQGMVTMRQDGWAKVEAGITTVEEVLRVV